MRHRVIATLLGAAAILTAWTYSAGQTICTFVPKTSGTIRRFPELGVLGPAPVGGDIQSSYFRTTPNNREFRRGFFEFSIPQFPNGVLGARLILSEGGGQISSPVPPDTHEISFYPSDLVVNTADYDRPTTFLATFETDANLGSEVFSFDVTSAYNQLACLNPGFRVKLGIDPSAVSMDSHGSDFMMASQGLGPKLEVTLPAGEPPCTQDLLLEPFGTNTLLTWTAASAATGYDVVRGSIQDVRAHGGYSNVTAVCAANNLNATSVAFSGAPPPGDAFFFMVRAEYSCGCGTYDSIRPMPPSSYFRDTLQACTCD